MSLSPIQSRKDLTVYIPGGELRRDREWLQSLRAEGPVLVLGRSDADMALATPGVWSWLAPKDPLFYDTILARASRVESPNPEVIARSLALRAKPTEGPSEGQGETFAFCCVADIQYVPFFFALVENLRAVHAGQLEIHLLAIQPEVEPLVRAQFPDLDIRFYSLKEIWGEGQWHRVAGRSIPLQAFSSKPRVLLEARLRSQADAVFLLDLDLYFYRSPARLNACFGNGHTLLFPQWSDRFSWARLHGAINSGMVGARKGSESFLSWWSQACWVSCELDAGNGRFVDQGFIDQANLYFDGITLYRDYDENIAAWNRRTLSVTSRQPHPVVFGEKAVGSFHAAGPDDDGLFERKFAWDQLVSLFSVIDDPNESSALFRNTLDQQRRHWPALDQALRLRHLAKERLKWSVAELNPEWAERATSPAGRWVLGGLDRLHAGYRKLRHGDAVDCPVDAENAFWVQLQRTAIFHPEKLLS